MGLAILILGLAIFIGAHSFVSLRGEREKLVARIGEVRYKGLFSLVSILGVVLIVYGFALYRRTAFTPLWYPPDFLRQLLDWRTLVGLVLYGGAAMLYIIALRRIPMSVALPCTAISYVAATLIGYFAFHEPITLSHIAAIGLITSGVLVLAFA